MLNATDFPERLARWRRRRGLTQDAAGEELGVTGKYVGMLERGDKPVDASGAFFKLFGLLERQAYSDTLEDGGRSMISDRGDEWGGGVPSEGRRLRLGESAAACLEEMADRTGVPASVIVEALITAAGRMVDERGSLSFPLRVDVDD